MTTWICPNCNEGLGELNGYCVYCKISDNLTIYNPDMYYIRDIRISHITSEGLIPMTPQEQLYSELFNHEKSLVKDMDVLTLRAHRESLAKIAFEARARLTAVDDEERQRKPKNDNKPTGFSRSVNVDESMTNAINNIKERQKRLTKAEKVLQGLKNLGIDTGDAEKLMSAGTILSRIKGTKPSEVTNVNDGKEIKTEPKLFFNPFEKK